MREEIMKIIEDYKEEVSQYNTQEFPEAAIWAIPEASFPALATAIEKLVREETKAKLDDLIKECQRAKMQRNKYEQQLIALNRKYTNISAKYEQLKTQQHGTDNV